jgi:hypothetical protein
MPNGGGGARATGSSGGVDGGRASMAAGVHAPASELGSKRLGNEELGKKRDVTENDCLRFVHSVNGGL